MFQYRFINPFAFSYKFSPFFSKTLTLICYLQSWSFVPASTSTMKRSSSSNPTMVPAKKSFIPAENYGFTPETIPPLHFHLGEDHYVVVSDFGACLNVHIRKYRTSENGRILPTRKGVSFSPFVWETLSRQCEMLSIPSDADHPTIIADTLFISTAWIRDEPHVSLQRYVTKTDFSRHFLPSVCVLSEGEWDRLQCLRKEITESCKNLMFGNFLRAKVFTEISKHSPPTSLEMDISDIEMILTVSLTEILSLHLSEAIQKVMVCDGCKEQQANQLGHDCVTLTHEMRLHRYGELALFSIDLELLLKDFADRNIQMLNYVNNTFLDKLNMSTLIKNAQDMYVASRYV